MTNRHLLNSYWRKTDLSLLTIGTLENLKIYKLCKGLSNPRMTELLETRNEHFYNIRHVSQFNKLSGNNWYHGIKNISFLGPKIKAFCQTNSVILKVPKLPKIEL